jgi:hypothetical protein
MIKITSLALCLMIGANTYAQNTDVVSIGGGDISNATISLESTIGELAVSDIGTNLTLEQGFQNTFLKVGLVVNAVVFLQGPYNDVDLLMNDDLRSLGMIPLKSPYIDSETATTQTVLDVVGDDAIVDWVFVEIRDRLVNDLVLAYRSGLLQRDGDVVDVDGVSPMEFDLLPGTYYVSVSHRNHLGAVSQNANLLTKLPEALDFTDNTFTTFGNFARVQLGTGAMALWAGNVNGDTTIKYAGTSPDAADILAYVLNSPQNFLNLPSFPISGYSNLDVDMNGFAQYTGTNPDTPLILQNVLSYPGNFLGLSTWPIIEQLPEN